MVDTFAVGADIGTYLQLAALATSFPVYAVTLFGLLVADAAQPRHALCIATRNSLVTGGCFYVLFVAALWAYVRYTRVTGGPTNHDPYNPILLYSNCAITIHVLLYIHDRSFVTGLFHCSTDVRDADIIDVNFAPLAAVRQLAAALWFLSEFAVKELHERGSTVEPWHLALFNNVRDGLLTTRCDKLWPLVCTIYLVASPLLAVFAADQNGCGGWTLRNTVNGTVYQVCDNNDTRRATVALVLDTANLFGLTAMQAYVRAYAVDSSVHMRITLGGDGKKAVLQ